MEDGMTRSVGLPQRWGIVGRMGGCKLVVVMALLSVGSAGYAAPVAAGPMVHWCARQHSPAKVQSALAHAAPQAT